MRAREQSGGFKPFGSLLKTDHLSFAKRMIQRQFPKLAGKEFDIREVGAPCPGCVEGFAVDYPFGRTHSNMVPSYQIRLSGSDEWKTAPVAVIPCKECQDTQLAREAWEAHQRAEIRRKTAKFWRINDELIPANLSNFDPMDKDTIEAVAIAEQFLDDWKSGDRYNLIFRGTYGAGKSHLLKAIAEEIRDMRKENGEPYTVGFIPMEEVLTMIKGTWGENHEHHNEQTIIQQLIDLDFLVLDDVGSEGGEWAGKKLFEIVNGRMGKPTGITTNWTNWDDFGKRFDSNGGKIVSRLRSNAKVFDIATSDKRIRER